jgi:hypothetical protein
LPQLLERGGGLGVVRRPYRRKQQRLGAGSLRPAVDGRGRAAVDGASQARSGQVAAVHGGAGLEVQAAEVRPVPVQLGQADRQLAAGGGRSAGGVGHLGPRQPAQQPGVESVGPPDRAVPAQALRRLPRPAKRRQRSRGQQAGNPCVFVESEVSQAGGQRPSPAQDALP